MLITLLLTTACWLNDETFPRESDSADTGFVDTADTDSDTDSDSDTDTSVIPIDADGDGFTTDVDCDDENTSVNPDAVETCDGLDNDCDSLVDDEDSSVQGQTTYYADGDGDGYGDAASEVLACEQYAGIVTTSGDCDDTDAAYHPDAEESDCTSTEDFNCDGSAGSDDLDGDGWLACEECNDTDAAVNPDANEVCDAADVDEDCSGAADNADPFVTGTTIYYVDSDADGYGDDATAYAACDAVTSSDVTVAEDCNDGRADVNPGVDEQCDGLATDENCNGLADDDDPTVLESGKSHLYHDADGDGFGDPATDTLYCSSPDASWIGDATDCDDADAAVNTAATEACDAVDNDCDGATDESGATGETSWYQDADGDGFGDAAASIVACDMPSGYVADDTDCDDTDAAYNPDASESCGDPDYDCDGVTPDVTDADGDGVYACDDCDDGDAFTGGATAWYDDADADSFGDAGATTSACDAPSGYVADDTDCDDADATVNPAATETCNSVDDDCNGSTDDGVPTSTWYADADADGYGDVATSSVSCSMPFGYVADDTDCDDADATVNPAATETCNSVDDDCDGTVDFRVSYRATFAPDFTTYSSLAIAGELLDGSGGTVWPYATWSTGSPSSVTVTTSATSITATFSECVESTYEWRLSISFVDAYGVTRTDCDLGLWTVTQGGVSVGGACTADLSAYTW